ncbi:hypothetical protein EJ08DRAFT_675589 [Tothia fuscella]|uniref:Killer toxin Kp4 domain-containing protein n=1 Tax=Tothia fuscella TaxID=1048955 RepID=A0A9P4NZ82_9PEZI|nr:hypothetical protein EJ08DRAFT_675589 [Tothia fuscella]
MRFTIPAYIITLTAVLPSTISALGINCRGSLWCVIVKNSGDAYGLNNVLKNLKDDAQISGTGLIACDVRICAFLGGWEENYKPIPGKEIKRLANEIALHRCHKCGSVPLGYPGDNNGGDGRLTFNWVEHPNCPGIDLTRQYPWGICDTRNAIKTKTINGRVYVG